MDCIDYSQDLGDTWSVYIYTMMTQLKWYCFFFPKLKLK